ncbi:SDR family NAD(P)-dependent oxidoreductase [Sphaerimonospora sp. CA-214678]|uniref:SDR family NAD(P)-dependent oxidoreductase n=1 Tax=Sphaerimonospora sp. CA-214678 TaxID=3240029 RepID=UPI003D932FC1
MVDLAGRTVIVTGGARGQGEAEVRRFIDANAHVLIADVLEERGRALAGELGERARFLRLDVTREEDWAAAVESLTDWPPVRVLVNNAGVHWKRGLLDESAAEMSAMLDVNVVGALLGTQAVTEAMTTAGGGSIVNVCSVLALLGGYGSAAYTTSKWALRGLTKAAALELGPRGIRVNAIHPGYIDTPMLTEAGHGRDPDHYRFLPLGRPGAPRDVAELVLFLASDESGYLTGGDFVIDGGMTAGGGPRMNNAATERGGSA